MAKINSLEISIQSNIDKVSKSLDNLIGNLGNAVEKTGKKLKNKFHTLPFDELNILSDASDDLPGILDGMGNININMDDMFDDVYGKIEEIPVHKWVQGIHDAVVSITLKVEQDLRRFTEVFNSSVKYLDWNSLEQAIGVRTNLFVKAFDTLTNEGEKRAELLGQELLDGFRELVDKVNWREIGNTLGNEFMAIQGMLEGFIGDMWRMSEETFLTGWAELGNALAEGIHGIVERVDFGRTGEALADGLNGIFKVISNFNERMAGNGTWKGIGENISDGLNNAISGIHPVEAGMALGKFVTDLLGTLLYAAEITPWDEFGKKVGQFLANIPWAAVIGQVFGIISNIFGGFFGGLAVEILSDFGRIGTALANGVNNAFERLEIFSASVPWDSIAENIYTGLNNMIHGIKWAEAGKTFGNFFMKLLGVLKKVVQETDWEGLGRGIGQFLSGIDWKEILESAFGMIQNVLGGLIEGLQDTSVGKIGLAVGAMALSFKELEKILPIVKSIFGPKGVIIAAIIAMLPAMAIGGKDLAAASAGLLNKILDGILEVVDKINWGEIGKNIIEFIGKVLTDLPEIIGKILALGTKIMIYLAKGLFEGITKVNWLELGKNLIGGLIVGIMSYVGELLLIPKKIHETIVNGIKDFFNINSPSIVMAELGEFIMQGLINGITSLVDFVAGIFMNLVGVIEGIWNGLSEFLGVLWEGIRAVAETVWTGISGFFTGIWDGMRTAAETAWNSVSEFLQIAWNFISENALAVWNGLSEFFVGIWNGIQETAMIVWNGISEFLGGIWNGIQENVMIVWNEITEFLGNTWNFISETATAVWSAVFEFFGGIWNGMKEAAELVWNEISECLNRIWNSISETAQEIWDSISEFFGGLWEGIKTTIETMWNEIGVFLENAWNFIYETAKTIWNSVSKFFGGIWRGIKETAEVIWNDISGFLEGIWNYVKITAETIWNKVSGFFSDTWNGIKEQAEQKWNEISNSLSNIWTGIKEKASQKWEELKAAISGAWDSIKETASEKWEEITETLFWAWDGLTVKAKGFLGELGKFFSDAWDEIKTNAKEKWDSITETLGNFAYNAYNKVRDIPDKVYSAVKDTGDKMKDVGGHLMNGLVEGIKSTAGKAYDAMSAVSETLPNIIRKINKINSPSKVFSEIAGFLMEGLVKGTEEDKVGVLEEMAGLAESITKPFDKISNIYGGSEIGKSLFDGMGNFVHSMSRIGENAAYAFSDSFNNNVRIGIGDIGTYSLPTWESSEILFNRMKEKQSEFYIQSRNNYLVGYNQYMLDGIEEAAYRGLARANAENTREENLLEELIQTVKEGKSITIDGREIVNIYDKWKNRIGWGF